MSYSIHTKGATKDEVLAQLTAKMTEMVAQQPIHEADKDKALAVADSFLSLLPDVAPDGKEFCISLSGSVVKDDSGFCTVSVSANVYLSAAQET